MKNIFLLAIAIFNLQNIRAQQEFGLSFLTHLVQTPVQTNPAVFTDHRVNQAFPNAYGGFQNSGFRIGDLFVDTPDGRRLELDAALNNMRPENNSLRTSAAVNGLALSFQIKNKVQISFFQNTRFDLQIGYPKALPELLWRGNAAFVGQEVEVAPKVNFLSYNEYGLGLAAKLGKKVSAGVNIKTLSGFVGVETIQAQTSVRTDEEYYQLTLQSDLLFRIAGLTDLLDEDEGGQLASDDPRYFIRSNNSGLAVDLGMCIQATPKLNLGLSVQNLGRISWKEYGIEYKSSGTFRYDGEIVRPFAEEENDFDFENVRDSIGDLFDFSSGEKVFNTKLPQRMTIVGRYQLDPKMLVGASFHLESWKGISNFAFAGHFQKQVGRWLYTGVMLGYHGNSYVFLGANATLQLGPVQLFAMTDNIVTLINPEAGRGTGVRAGLNLSFQRKKEEKKEEVLPEMINPDYYK